MSITSSFHTQLASIMDVLTKAAVAEMCEVVDNGYAVLHLEITRSQKENKALKNKLHMMELRIARGSDDRIARASSANSVQICDELRQTTPRMDECFNIYTNVWDNGEHRTVDEDDTKLPSTTDRSADKEKIRPESLLIKMETLEEDFENSKPQGGVNINEEKALESDGGERATIADSETESAMGTKELSEQHGTRHNVWEDSGLDTVLKAEPGNEPVNLQDAARRPNHLGNKYALYERPGHLDTFFTQSSIQTETEGPTCSYSLETNSESMTVQSELQLACIAEKGSGRGLSTLDSLDKKPEVVMIDILDSVSNKLDAGLSSSWSKEATSGAVLKRHRYYKENGKRGALQPDVMNVCPSESHVSMREHTANSEVPNINGCAPRKEGLTTTISVTANHRAGVREKRFLCSHCWKSFTCLNNLETHQRVHTGEKPFGCTQCGKRFSQSAYLRKHFSVHTGKKPFRCTKCGKCFSDSSNFKRHQYVHTGERPFRCMQCGKRFSFLGNLKRHQSIHLGNKPLGHTPWEEFTHLKSP